MISSVLLLICWILEPVRSRSSHGCDYETGEDVKWTRASRSLHWGGQRLIPHTVADALRWIRQPLVLLLSLATSSSMSTCLTALSFPSEWDLNRCVPCVEHTPLLLVCVCVALSCSRVMSTPLLERSNGSVDITREQNSWFNNSGMIFLSVHWVTHGWTPVDWLIDWLV